MKANSKNKENGAILTFCLFMLPILLFLAFASIALIYRMQNKLALHYRLDLCASRVLYERSILLKNLTRENQSMQLLRAIVYTARNASIILPPAAAILGMSEKAALLALRKLKMAQDFAIRVAKLTENRNRYCKATPYSSQLASCKFLGIQEKAFQRVPALYPDVPGHLRWNGGDPLLRVECQVIWQKQELAQAMKISGDKELQIANFTYDYEF